jgi:predicted O-methyltransferase YrrM
VPEIDTQAGTSTVHLAAGLADAYPGSAESRLLTVDIKDVNDSEEVAWKAFRLPQSPRDAMARLGYDHLVRFRTGRSLEVLREPGESFDLIFLDGDHRLNIVALRSPRRSSAFVPAGFSCSTISSPRSGRSGRTVR